MPVRKASIDLMRAIPRGFKGGIRNLQDVGFKGFKVSELTPNITRRGQLCNWIMYYREKLHGKTLQELIEEKNNEPKLSPEEANLPSEKAFQRLRLDVDVEEEDEPIEKEKEQLLKKLYLLKFKLFLHEKFYIFFIYFGC